MRLRLLPLLALSGCALWSLATQRAAWPEPDGEVTVRGPTRPVAIARDDLGVPHIRASSSADAMFALGFVHAQDRLFQADVTRRLTRGELSLLLGEDTVAYDGFARALGITERAGKAVAAAPFEVQAVLEAYSLGFNAGRDSLKQLPVEYRLLGVDEVPDWTPADCVAQAWLQSWNLSENPNQELAALALRDLPSAKLDALVRYEAETPPLDPYWETLRSMDLGPWSEGWEAWNGLYGGLREPASQASNNWIVGPSRSADGKPIVANDPHLGQRVPSIWYAADLQGGDLHVAGVTFPGSPAVIIGHNERVAWGLTNVMADYVDLAVLETRDDGRKVVVAGEEVPITEVTATVDVLRGEPVQHTTRMTPLGPVLTDPTRRPHVVVLRWHALEVADESIPAFYQLNRATSAQAAVDAMNRPLVVAQNLVVADVDGDYLWQAVGSVPVRKAHTGRVPYPGSDPAHGWNGWYAALPGERAPERGFVATANARPTRDLPADPLPPPVDEGKPAPKPPPAAPPTPIAVHGISTGWDQPWRQRRIDEQLGSKGGWTPQAVAALQTDVRDPQAAAVLPALLEGVTGTTDAARKCRNLLATWDHEATTDAVGPTVWITFQRELLREALEDELGADGFDVYLQAHGPGRTLLPFGLDGFVTDRRAAVDAALTATCTRLEGTLGTHEDDWAWGRWHPLALEHPFAAESFLLRGWNAPIRDFPGNASTVAAASAGWEDGEKRVGGMPSVRLVMPLGDLAKSTLVYPGGQSGLPRHPDAFTHFDAFVKGETLPLYFSDADVAAHTVSTVVLRP